jgi:hypothetical protein
MSEVRLSPLDAAWIITESRATPNHVGGLLQFRLPDDAPREFLKQLMQDFRNHREFQPPWNRRLKYAFNKNPVPVWVEDDDIDLEYHVRHAAFALARRRTRTRRIGRPPARHSDRPHSATLGMHDHRGA